MVKWLMKRIMINLQSSIREFNKLVNEDKRVEQIIMPLGDGMTICRVL